MQSNYVWAYHTFVRHISRTLFSCVRKRGTCWMCGLLFLSHDDVVKWKHCSRYWPFVRGIQRSPVNYPHKGQLLGALTFYLIWALNKRLSKHSWSWWFETPLYSLWRHCNDHFDYYYCLCLMYARDNYIYLLAYITRAHKLPGKHHTQAYTILCI